MKAKSRPRRLVSASGACILIATLCTLCWAADKPSAALMAAALRSQEADCGASLDARYTWTQHVDGISSSEARKLHYVRTPDVLFLEEEVGGLRKTESYDKARNEYKSLAVLGTGEKYGLVRDRRKGTFTNQDLPETTQYPLFGGTFAGLLERGTVSDAQEDVDGRQCWRVSIPRPGLAVGYVAWVDPSIGFCPRRIQIMWRSAADREVVCFNKYEQISPDVWFPRELVIESENGAGRAIKTTMAVDDVRVGTEIARELLLVSFPTGTNVTIGTGETRIEYVQP